MIQAGTIRTGSAWTVSRGGRVLDELDQPIAVDDLARGDRHRSAHLEGLRAGRLPAEHGPLPVLDEVHRTPEEVGPALLPGRLQDLGVGPREVRRREDVEQLPRRRR